MFSLRLRKLLVLMNKKEFEQLQHEIDALSKSELIQVLGELTLLQFSEQTTLGGIRESLYVEMSKVIQKLNERSTRNKELPIFYEFLDKDRHGVDFNSDKYYLSPDIYEEQSYNDSTKDRGRP